MGYSFKLRSAARDKPAGSLIFIGEKKLEKTRIRAMVIDRESLVEKECNTIEEAYSLVDSGKNTWINVDGLHDPEIFSEIGRLFHVNNLLLEDIMNTDHMPKFSDYELHNCIITKMLSYDKEEIKVNSEQFSIIIGPHYILSFQERVGIYFESLRERIRQAKVRVLSIYPSYVAYALIDSVVDAYMEIVGEIGAEIDSIEEEILTNPRKSTVGEIYRHRSEINFLRKTIRPLKDVTTQILKSESEIIKNEIRHYLADLNDHVVAILEYIESYQTINMDQFNMYNTGIQNKANEIMKTLTVFASIFIPLTFVAGIYGMNFEVIPELRWKLGYLFFWGITLCISLGFYFYFKHKKWF